MGKGVLGRRPVSETLVQQASPQHVVLVWCCAHAYVGPAGLGTLHCWLLSDIITTRHLLSPFCKVVCFTLQIRAAVKCPDELLLNSC